MIIKDTLMLDDIVLIDRIYSDKNVLIENKNGVRYHVALDPAGLNLEYAETDIKIDNDTYRMKSELVDKAYAYDILMGARE